MLNQVSVLIVEDEPFIALDLAMAVEEARGKVIGPAGSVREALMLIEQHQVQAAILDVNLSDRDVTPIAERLIGGGVPVIFYSGLDLPAALRERYPSAWFYKKPTPAAQLLNRLAASMPRVETVLSLGVVDLPAVRSSPVDYTRQTSKSVVFSHPFELKGVDRILPPGDYRVVTDEEQIEELSFPVYRRVATMIFVPAESGNASTVEMVTIDPQDLQAAQELDLNHGA